jgi:hypothetical protein
VIGKEKDVDAFVENVKGTKKYETEGYEFDFNHFIPQPENIFRGGLSMQDKERLDKEGTPNWYDWNYVNWGTKWNACCDDFERGAINGSPHFAKYYLRTAWADPRPVIMKLIEMYKNLDIYIEGEEESNAYGIYISTRDDFYLEEEPTFVDEMNERAVYFSNDNNEYLWRYVDNDELVPDQEDFYPMNKYSWT